MTLAITRNKYGLNSISNPTLDDYSDPDNGMPYGYTFTPTGTLEYNMEWSPQSNFSGTPIRVIIYSLDQDAYVELASIKFQLEPVYECNPHVETCHFLRYRLQFEYQSTAPQALTVKYYNMVKGLLRTDHITLPTTPEQIIWSMILDAPDGKFLDQRTVYVQFSIKTSSVMSYTISNIRLNQFLFADTDVPPEPILSYAADRMNRCFSSDVYDITALDQAHQALVAAISSQIDKARSIVLTVLNNLYLSYMNGDLIEEYGALINMPRYAFEEDRDYLYKERLNLWKRGYGGGCKLWVKNFLEYFINWDMDITYEAMEPSGTLIEYDPIKSSIPYAQILTDCEILNMLRDEVMAGVFVAGEYVIEPALVSDGTCEDIHGAWVGNGEKGVDGGSLITNAKGK